MDIDPQIEKGWKKVLDAEFSKQYFHELKQFLVNEFNSDELIFPPAKLIFNAFDQTPFDKVRVVILGQDPYHGSGQAHGLCFSVPDGIKPPPSLVNMFKEMRSDLDLPISSSGDLTKWAKQGVLLLNATLTVKKENAGSHQKKGWEQFTDSAIRQLSDKKQGIIFLLWGRYAREKSKLIDGTKHFILEAAHPSPLSAYNGFFGCRHFSKTNQYLIEMGQKPIDWNLG